MELVTQSQCFGGTQSVYRHASQVCGVEMTFGLYMPPQARTRSVPLLWYLSGLTCTHENAMIKAGLQRYAAEQGLALVFPDTSPRGEGVADDEAYDLGQGAGFYVNATQKPWSPHYRMYDYIVTELPALLQEQLPLNGVNGITGHSMGGHGALTIAFRNPELFRSVSAFAPIVNPTRSDWGRKQFSAYLGDDEADWGSYDACLLLGELGWHGDILIDQGAADQFLDELQPEAMARLLAERRQAGVVRLQAGYDHSYYFVASFGEDHVRWHAERLNAA
ncbi:S-formylglutathione hydrolase [Sinorhizobium meliloti]|uniref:S-formylglutathione hydrolase n=1 Tax=Rhizobium meliloti TaxID=382 RepID=UPI000FD7686B|nr:S-formylglutathione hydrolase [Sinorhizobium meliloti]RVH89022.1 S-formylglutathione hydrolase [Sinorhizobium meliloti]RVM30898.1 S-formylglutathione hydrolase [Sinorhizobium meliloti]RVO01812.1 S-formylglutathione hydrolase [Sinorhizobium meliloti]